MTYRPHDIQSILTYAKSFTEIFPADADLSCEEIGDGNLNLVFRVIDGEGRSLIFKQALPYARVVGESWPLTIERNRIEHDAIQKQAEFVQDLVPKIYSHDAELATTVMEDLSQFTVLRRALVNGYRGEAIFESLGVFLARTLFFTSDLYLDAEQKKQEVKRFVNPELCRITELLIFTDPYYDAETNDIPDGLQDAARQIWADEELKQAAARLKWKFMTQAEALLHGDLHSGSIMVSGDKLKVFDAEFAYYGPMGFDIGLLMGNILLNLAGNYPDISKPEDAGYWLTAAETVWNTFERNFVDLLTNHITDAMFKTKAFQSEFLATLLKDSLGFAGAEMIRRTIGLAHVLDLDGIEDTEKRTKAQKFALQFGTWLIKSAKSAKSIEHIRDGLGVFSGVREAE